MVKKLTIVGRFGEVSRHFVSLTWFQQDIRDDPRDATWKNFAVSGFIMSFQGTWYLATAGHILKQLEQNKLAGATRVHSMAFVDHGGVAAQFQGSVPFDFDDAETHFVVDDNAGLDYGFIKIEPFYRRPLEANAVKPLTEQHWKQKKRTFRNYSVYGVPTVFSHIQQQTATEPRIGRAQITNMPVKKLPKKNEPKPLKYPRFFAKVIDPKVQDIDGFSGGPVIGFGAVKGKKIVYRVVAMQFAWNSKTRVIRASPLSVFAKLFEDYLASNRKPRQKKTAGKS